MTERVASPEPDSPEARLRRYVLYDEVNAPYLQWQLEQFKPFLGNRILEVGCGVGAILAQLGERELVMGIDLEPELVEFTRMRFAAQPRYEFASMDIAELSDASREAMKAQAFDTIVCINVLEHIKVDSRAVATMADLLVPGGVLAILVPAHPFLFGPYDVTDGHFRRYTKSSLRRVLESAGFAGERLYHFNAVGAAGWWFQYKLMKRDHQTQSDYRIMQAMVPLMSAIEKRIKPPFGLSLVAVARKPSGAGG